MNVMDDTVPPHDHDAEMALLALIMGDNSLLDDPACTVAVDDFYTPSHAAIFRAARKQRAAGEAFDGVTAFDTLGDHPDALERVKVIMNLGYDRALRHHAPHYAQSIREKSQRRKLLISVGEIGAMVRDSSNSIDDITARVESMARSGGHGSSRFEWHTPADLDAGDFELDYLIDGILVAGQPCITAGPQKVLKTNILVDLSLSLATGHPFLGEFFVNNRVNVGLMTGESGAATIQETARRIAWSKGWALSRVEGLFVSFDIPALTNPSSLAEIRRFIEEHDLRCLAIDPIYLAMSGVAENASNVFSMGERLAPLGDLAKRTGCTIVLCHHTKKVREKQFEPPKLEDIAFAGFSEFARQWVLLGRREAYDPEQPGSHRLWLEVGGSAGHTGRWGLDVEEGSRADPEGRVWSVDVRSGRDVLRERGESAADEKLAQREAEAKRKETAAIDKYAPKVISFLKRKEHLDGASKSNIRNSVGCNQTTWRPVFDYLSNNGIIEPCRYRDGQNRERDGYKLADPEIPDNIGQPWTIPISPKPRIGGDVGLGLTPLRGESVSPISHPTATVLLNGHGRASPEPRPSPERPGDDGDGSFPDYF